MAIPFLILGTGVVLFGLTAIRLLDGTANYRRTLDAFEGRRADLRARIAAAVRSDVPTGALQRQLDIVTALLRHARFNRGAGWLIFAATLPLVLGGGVLVAQALGT